MSATALQVAFEAAGFVDPERRLCDLLLAALRDADSTPPGTVSALAPLIDEGRNQKRLREIAMTALTSNVRNWDAAKDAFFKAVRNDAGLLWALFEPYRGQAAQRILSEVSAQYHAEQKAAQAAKAGQRGNGGGLLAGEYHTAHAPSKAPAAAERARAMDAAATVRLSKLDTFRVNGRPIGELTPREASAWAKSRARDVRFVTLLTQNLPPDKPIKEFIRGEEADALYARATAEDE